MNTQGLPAYVDSPCMLKKTSATFKVSFVFIKEYIYSIN